MVWHGVPCVGVLASRTLQGPAGLDARGRKEEGSYSELKHVVGRLPSAATEVSFMAKKKETQKGSVCVDVMH